jgi:DNA ligase-1
MQIQKPLLAGTFDPDKAKFPYAATPKIDGIRFLMVDGVAVSRSFKPIRNEYVQRILSKTLPDGIDGELTCGTNFQDSTSGIMTIKGEPDFHVWIFDYVESGPETILPYEERMCQLEELEALGEFVALKGLYTILYPCPVNDIEDVQKLTDEWTENGYEGVMLRDPFGTYKFGRSSVKEGIILKVKKFMDAEGIVVDFKEKMSNQNEATRNELGYTERKGGRGGMVPAGTLGAVKLMLHTGQTVWCGSGFNDELRKEIWENQETYKDQFVKFKYMEHGVKDLPRHPIFLGFRDIDDMS